MDADHDDDGATFSGNGGEEMAMEKEKKQKENTLTQKNLPVPYHEGVFKFQLKGIKIQEVMALFMDVHTQSQI